MLYKYLLVFVLSYALGSLSLSIFVSKRFFGNDVRSMGSGNAGATNMARVYGMGAGAFTLFGDAAKAAAAMLIGFTWLGEPALTVSGVACILGHCYPVFHDFKGGKGVSVGAAIAFAVDWRVGVLALTLFFLIAFSTKKVSLSSVTAAAGVFAGALIFAVSDARILLAAFSALLVIIRHKENIKRLLAGTEPDFKPRKKQKYEKVT